MANGGPFGNPLSTGIALNFEVDMTPYRQMMQDNLAFAKTQAADRKKKEKEFQDILKNITYDDSKILKRRRDGAKVKYAELISDAIKLDKAGDVGGLTMRIAEFDSGMNNLVDEKTKFNTYEKLTREGKHFGSQGFIDAMNSVDDGETSDVNIIERYSANTIYDAKNGVFDMHAIPKADPMAFVNKALQGMAFKTAVDGSGNPLKPTYLPETGEYKWDLSRVDDPEALIQELGMAWAGGGESNIETMRMGMGLEPEDLGGDGAVTNSVEYIRKFVEPKLTGSRYSSKPTPKTGYNYGFGNQNSIADVGFSSSPPSSVTRSYSTDAQKAKAVLDQAMVQLGENISTIDATGGMTDSREDFVMPTVLADLGFTKSVPTYFGDKVTISKGSVSKEFDPTATNFPQELRKFVETNTTDEDISSNTDVASHASAAEKSTNKLLTPTTNTMVMDIAGGKTPESIWGFKKGDRVILSGDNNAVEVVLNNDVSLQKGIFTGAGKYKDSSDVENTYYSLLFPVKYQTDEGLYSDFFNGESEALNKFKKLNKDALPSMIKVVENQSLKKTLLSLAQTTATSKVGGMPESFLDEQMRINMTPLNNTGGQAASGSSTTNTPSFQ